ncbi:MAG: CPBP family intramembrane metalloprotease [Anaerolineaceae bacterium]|nr:CPBP family intramembrane metalloprotease [Anaerolineaceae bacterium]
MKRVAGKNRTGQAQPGELTGAFPTAFLYLVSISLGELLTAGDEPLAGLVLHGLVLLLLIVQGAAAKRRVAQRFYFSMALVPLIRLMSLSLPLTDYLFVYWYLIIGTPLFLAAFFTARMVGLSIDRLLFNPRHLGFQILVALSGVLLGYIEYLILRPQPLVESFSFYLIWQPALILLIFTGLLEEVIFRGLLQQSAREYIGRWGLLYASLLFAVMHLGYRSMTDFLFVLMVALFFGLVVNRTRSILGVTLAHGLTNIGLFLVFPFLAAAPYQMPDWLPMPPPVTVVVTVPLPTPTNTSQPTFTWTPEPTLTATLFPAENTPQSTLVTLTPAMTPPAPDRTPIAQIPFFPFPETFPQANVQVPNDYLIMVDDGDPGFLRTGGTTWLSVNGIGEDLVWASPVAGEADAVVEWRPDLPAAGRYEVQVFCPEEFATFRFARYEIGSLDGFITVLVDQSAHQGKWASLGVYSFEAGEMAFLRLDNQTTSEPGLDEVISFDAARWLRVYSH